MTAFSSDVALTADYGQRVYSYALTVTVQDGHTTLTLTAPETVAGITAHMDASHTFLTYEDSSVETGNLSPDGLTPMSAVPALLDAIRSGYLTTCTLESDGRLRMDCGTPDVPIGTGTELSLWFYPESHTLAEGEIRIDGFRYIACTFSNITKE